MYVIFTFYNVLFYFVNALFKVVNILQKHARFVKASKLNMEIFVTTSFCTTVVYV